MKPEQPLNIDGSMSASGGGGSYGGGARYREYGGWHQRRTRISVRRYSIVGLDRAACVTVLISPPVRTSSRGATLSG